MSPLAEPSGWRQELRQRLAAQTGTGLADEEGRRAKMLTQDAAFEKDILDHGSADEFGFVSLPRSLGLDAQAPRARRKPQRQTVCIFDWDDTLLCTSFLCSSQDRELLPQEEQCLRGIASLAARLLGQALQHGHTFIVTNAEHGWVEHSAARYAPELLPVLQRVCVISARGRYEAQYPGDAGKWKIQAFLEVQRQLDAQVVTNLISIGDSAYEMEAVHVMGREFAQATVKTVKFLERPRPEALLRELALVAGKFKRIVDKAHGLQISLGSRQA